MTSDTWYSTAYRKRDANSLCPTQTTWTVEGRLHRPQLQSRQDEQQNSYKTLLSQGFLLNQKACMSHLSGLYIHITVNILQNHLRSRGRSSICEHKMVSGGGNQQQKTHVKGIYEFLWGVTDKTLNVWAVFGNFSSLSRAVSAYGVWMSASWRYSSQQCLCVSVMGERTWGSTLFCLCHPLADGSVQPLAAEGKCSLVA